MSALISSAFQQITLILAFLTIRGDAVTVVGIVVVDVPVRIYVTDVVSISGVGRQTKFTIANPYFHTVRRRVYASFGVKFAHP